MFHKHVNQYKYNKSVKNMKIDCNPLPPVFTYSWYKNEARHAYIKTISAILPLLNQEQIITKVCVRGI